MTIDEIEVRDAAGYRGPDRRRDLARRARVGRMSRAELERELLTDHLTGLPNRRAWDEWLALTRPEFVAVVDVDGLKWVNDTWGHYAGDELLKAVARALAEEGLGAFRVGGDEFAVAFSRDLDAWEVLGRVQRRLRRARWPVLENWATGARVSFAVAPADDPARLEARLRWMKDVRQQMGLRAARGERPPGLRFCTERELLPEVCRW